MFQRFECESGGGSGLAEGGFGKKVFECAEEGGEGFAELHGVGFRNELDAMGQRRGLPFGGRWLRDSR